MHKISSANTTAGNEFQDAVPAIGQRGTTVSAKWLNTIQRELINILVPSEIEPDETIDNQIIASIQNLIAVARASAIETAKVPTGTVFAFGGATAPNGYLICNGSAVSRATYSDLYAIVGTFYGVGDGSTTFNLPDLRGRVIVGVGEGTGLTNRNIGSTGGAETHQLTVNQLPSHSHGISVSASDSGSTTTVDGASGTDATIQTANEGGNEAHNNMQPYQALNYIIKI